VNGSPFTLGGMRTVNEFLPRCAVPELLNANGVLLKLVMALVPVMDNASSIVVNTGRA